MAQEEFKVPELHDNPTPEERAEFVSLRLEQFIRDGRTIAEGMSFKKWQTMAKVEIANAIAAAELTYQREEQTTNRLLFTFASALITIGFWGTAVSLHKVGYLAGGLVCFISGALLMAVATEWRFRVWNKKRRARKRAARLIKIEDLNKRIKKMEVALEKTAEDLEDELAKLFS